MKRKALSVAALLMAVLLLLSSCGGAFSTGGGNSTDNTSTGTEEAAQTTGIAVSEEEQVWTLHSAYARAQSLGYGGTLEEFLASIQGEDGTGILSVDINDNGELVVNLTNGSFFNLGVVVGRDGKDGKMVKTVPA